MYDAYLREILLIIHQNCTVLSCTLIYSFRPEKEKASAHQRDVDVLMNNILTLCFVFVLRLVVWFGRSHNKRRTGREMQELCGSDRIRGGVRKHRPLTPGFPTILHSPPSPHKWHCIVHVILCTDPQTGSEALVTSRCRPDPVFFVFFYVLQFFHVVCVLFALSEFLHFCLEVRVTCSGVENHADHTETSLCPNPD